jgi:hypothetical protein
MAVVESHVSPVRRLYAALVALDSRDGVHENLLAMEDGEYAKMAGDPEPRFCEWAYQRLENRTLVSGLLGTVLRPSDARRLAVAAGCDARQLDGLAPAITLREAFRALGVHEPTLPSPVRDGLRELERCASSLDAAINETQPATLKEPEESGTSPAVELGRRGAERLLKVLCFFLWDAGFSEIIRCVVSTGLRGYNATDVQSNEWEKWLHGRDLGQFNYLLKAISDEVKARGLRAPFLSIGQDIWPEAAFSPFGSLAEALQTAVHDTQTTVRYEPEPKRRMLKQFKAAEKALSRFSAASSGLWRPRTIQFFRRVDDGQSIHHEGYDENGGLVRFYESAQHYELHVPYLFVAATNPSAVDFACTKLRSEFTRSV